MDHALRSFSLTGTGLKSRAHPLAVAIALDQLRKLDSLHTFKTRYAQQMIEKLREVRFFEMAFFRSRGSEPAWYAFAMRFKASYAPKALTREIFVKELTALGLKDVDVPKSTCLLNKEPLLTSPQVIFPHLYPNGGTLKSGGSFEKAHSFHDEAIKLPVYATADGQDASDRCITIIGLVAAEWQESAREWKL